MNRVSYKAALELVLFNRLHIARTGLSSPLLVCTNKTLEDKALQRLWNCI